jgi:hypothetical protein
VLFHIILSASNITTISRLRRTQESTCSAAAYATWQSDPYTGILKSDENFWRYQTQETDEFFITNGLAIELAVASCKNRFDLLKFYKAGRSGPIDIQNVYKVMCKTDCIEADSLHEEAMTASGCSCLELSTQPSSVSYHVEGDWCEENTARMMCSMVGFCGVWDCRIDDFMCPKYEWYKKNIALKGPGSCVRNSATSLISRDSFRFSLGLVVFVTMFIFFLN